MNLFSIRIICLLVPYGVFNEDIQDLNYFTFYENTIYLSALEGRLGHAYGATSRASIPSRLCPLCECGHVLCKSPTSLREAPPLCLISMSSMHKGTTTTRSSGRGVPCSSEWQQNRAGVKPYRLQGLALGLR